MSMKLTKPQSHAAYSILVALGISFLMAIGVTIIDGGLKTIFSGSWFTHWFLTFLIAIPAAWFVLPVARKITDKISLKQA